VDDLLASLSPQSPKPLIDFTTAYRLGRSNISSQMIALLNYIFLATAGRSACCYQLQQVLTSEALGLLPTVAVPAKTSIQAVNPSTHSPSAYTYEEESVVVSLPSNSSSLASLASTTSAIPGADAHPIHLDLAKLFGFNNTPTVEHVVGSELIMRGPMEAKLTYQAWMWLVIPQMAFVGASSQVGAYFASDFSSSSNRDPCPHQVLTRWTMD
jgi:hypothetical protein